MIPEKYQHNRLKISRGVEDQFTEGKIKSMFVARLLVVEDDEVDAFDYAGTAIKRKVARVVYEGQPVSHGSFYPEFPMQSTKAAILGE